MAIELNVRYDTSTNSHNPSAYEVSLAECDEALHPLRQVGAIWNNVVSYRGIFANRRSASEAALDYIAAKCRLVEKTDVLSGHTTVCVQPLTLKPAAFDGYHYRVLGSNLPTGRFMAEG